MTPQHTTHPASIPPGWRTTNRLQPEPTDARKVYEWLPEEMTPWNGPYTVLLDGDVCVREIHLWHVGNGRSEHFILPDENVADSWLVARRNLGDEFGREMKVPGGRLDDYRLLCRGAKTAEVGQ